MTVDRGKGYGVRIRQPEGAGEEWAADLSLMISPILGEDFDSLEDALKRGELIVAQGLPFDEAKQLVGVFQSLGADAEVVDRPATDGPRGMPVRPGDAPGLMGGTQPFNMAGLRKALEAAAESAPPLGLPAVDGGLPPLPGFDPPPIGDGADRPSGTRPFDPGMVRAALARVGESADDGPLDLPPVLGGDEDEDVPTAVAAARGRRPAYAEGLMGVLDGNENEGPGDTQAFGAGVFEPPPPPPGADGSFEGPPPPAGSFEGPPPPGFDGPPPPDRGVLAGFAAPAEPFDPGSVRRLREGGPRRGFPGVPDMLDGPSLDDFGGAPRRGAAIGDKPTDRLLMPPGMDPRSMPPPRAGDGGFGPPDLEVPPLSRPGPGPMIVQLDAPSVDPSETGTFTREASLDPLAEEDEVTRRVGAISDEEIQAELRKEARKAAPQRGLRPGVYQLDRGGQTDASNLSRPGTPAAGAAILSTGQMVARPIARPDEEVTDSGSFRIVKVDGEEQPSGGGHGSQSPALAALLSLVLPGMGQVYNGQRDRGIMFALAAVLIVPWLLAIGDAWVVAGEIRRGRRPAPDPRTWEKGRWGQLLLNIAVIFSVVVALTIWTGMQDEAPGAPPPEKATPTEGG